MDMKDQLILLLTETREQILATKNEQERIKFLLTEFSLEDRLARIES